MKKQTIEEACTLHARIGWQGLTKAEYLDSGAYYLVTGVDFSDGLIDFEHCHYVTQDRYEQDEHIQLKADDVLVTKDGTIGKVAIIECLDKPATLNSGVFVVRPKNKSSLLPEYLVFSLRSGHFSRFIEQIKVGCTIAHLNQAKFLKYEIPDISVEEQQHVIDILKRAETIVKASQEELRKLDELIKARFIELFGDLKSNSKGWPIVGFNECAEIDTNMIHDFEGYEDYPHIGIDSIEKETGRLSGYRTVAEDGVISGKYLFTEKHIIYSKIRPNLNKVAMPDFVGVCSADAYPILVKDDICVKEYLGYTMRSKYFLDYIVAFSNRTNLPKVNKKQVEGFALPLPPMELQQQFAVFVSQVDKSKVAE